ncbi:hypothetical protein N7455_007030 [Penicillium solitum]|uniref:uncharacterized protein n=1 Tax=Penicillium solitum TaxID=60172 RepID=UPI0032C3F3F6|nr:hypothetical protein N7455_007030 [Penicillium solitum]
MSNISMYLKAYPRGSFNQLQNGPGSPFLPLLHSEYTSIKQSLMYLGQANIIGAEATIEHVQKLAYQSHRRPLFFVEWDPLGGNDGTQKWQYLLDVDTNSIKKIVTDPPTFNVHGYVSYQGHLYVATDGAGRSESGSLVQIDPFSEEKGSSK